MARGRRKAGKPRREKMENLMKLAKKRFSKDGLEMLWDFFLAEEEENPGTAYKEFKKLFKEFGPEAEDDIAKALGVDEEDSIEDYGNYLGWEGGFMLDLRTLQ
jgi:hypothetical protein